MVASGKARFYPALMLGLVRFFIRIYQWTLSPLLRLLCGPNSGCRFTPDLFGIFFGSSRGAWRPSRKLAGIEAPRSMPALGRIRI